MQIIATIRDAVEAVFSDEGGYSDHPRDRGGATNLGITRGDLSRWLGRPATRAEVRALTRPEAEQIYRHYYWIPVRADDLPPGVGYYTFDFAVHSGVWRASRFLQTVVGAPVDGKIGEETVTAAWGIDPVVVLERLHVARKSYLISHRDFDVFGDGWLRRIKRVRERALRTAFKALAAGSPGPAARTN